MRQNFDLIWRVYPEEFCKRSLNRWHITNVISFNPTALNHFSDWQASKKVRTCLSARIRARGNSRFGKIIVFLKLKKTLSSYTEHLF
ncbi:protein of unknown function [Azospirillum lipoferum 4B]|uniref:Uncharacterized protein n=1 Tax=Azospirillum lipoferum (strain 4B) TaxID=862719 RepID=G7Z7L9_AZOL4|nr:protein of unknown function [Azospirillum lipoferum 4B]